MEEPPTKFIVGMRVNEVLDQGSLVPGSRIRKCLLCEERSYYGPATLPLEWQGALTVCSQCVAIHASESAAMVVTDGSLAEFQRLSGYPATKAELIELAKLDSSLRRLITQGAKKPGEKD